MASQIYSRYIPPSKKKIESVVKEVQIPAPIQPQSPANPTPPPTLHDASSTYARYIPPLKKKAVPVQVTVNVQPEIVKASPSSKRKHEEFVDSAAQTEEKPKKQKREGKTRINKETQEIPQTRDVNIIETVQESAKEIPKKVRSKKKALDELQEDEDLAEVKGDDDARHNKLLKKREKSLRRAEKAAKKAAEEGVPEDEPVIEEPTELHDLVPFPQPEPVPELEALDPSASLPPWIANPIRVPPNATASFASVGIHEEVANHLQKKGFKEAFAVQAAALPLLLPGVAQQDGDVLVSAATGSGKTLAYVLPMIEDISRNQVTKLRGLIVLPTRELVSQAREVSDICSAAFSKRRRLQIGTAVGNETFKGEQGALMEQTSVYDPLAYQQQQNRLNRKWQDSDCEDDGNLCDDEIVSRLPNHVIRPVSKVDILICTPGRLVEHIKSTPGFTLEHVKWLVVDEADKLLDQSFQQWLDVVMPSLHSPRKVILSATMTRDVGQLNGLRLHRPKLVVLEGEEEGFANLHLPALLVESGTKIEDEGVKPLYLMEILKREGLITGEEDTSDSDSSSDESSEETSKEAPSTTTASSSDEPHGVLIFTKSNETAVRLGRLIALLQPSTSNKIGTLTSTTRSSARKAALKSFEAGRLTILVASDLVSRGLDLANLAHVINYDVPTSLTSYVHRVGRTARAGKTGHAWTLFTASEGRWFWNEIGRAEGVKRSRKVERVNINHEIFEGQRTRYEEVLEELGKEASSAK